MPVTLASIRRNSTTLACPPSTITPANNLRRAVHKAPMFNEKIIAVRVGPDSHSKSFSIHENILRLSSRFLDNAFRHDWKEREKDCIELPECNSEAFEIYVSWLYTGRVFITREGDERTFVSKDGTKLCLSQEGSRWKRCYILANFLQDTSFSDCLIDTIQERMRARTECPVGLGAFLEKYSGVDSMHRNLALDITASVKHLPVLDDLVTKEYTEFEGDVILLFAKVALEKEALLAPVWKREVETGCVYHEHMREGKDCYKGMRW